MEFFDELIHVYVLNVLKSEDLFSRKDSLEQFQCTLLVEIRTLVTWLKSILLLKIECHETHTYMKTECLQTKWDAAFI
jgi:hypothetical protein